MFSALPFFTAQYTFCSNDQGDLHFHGMFPAEPSASLGQNFHKCTYYRSWLDLMSSLDRSSCSRVQAAVKFKFNELVWISYTACNRMWCTCPLQCRGWFMLPHKQPPAGPQIAFSPKFHTKGLPLRYLRQAPDLIPDHLDKSDSNEHPPHPSKLCAEMVLGNPK